MPGYNISVESQQLSDVTVEQEGSNVSVDGKYTVTVVNNGILPIFSGTLSVTELTLFNGAVTAIENGSSSIPTISGGSTKDASVEFSFTQSSSSISSQVSSMCSTGSTTATINGSVSGLLLGKSISSTPDDPFSLNAGNPNCNLGGNGGELVPPEEQPPEQRPPGSEQPPSGGGGGNGAPPEQGTGSIEIVEGPDSSGNTTLRVEGDYSAILKSFDWRLGDGSTASGREVSHRYGSSDRYNVTCTVSDDVSGNVIDQISETVRIDIPERGEEPSPPRNGTDSDIQGPTTVILTDENEWTWEGPTNWTGQTATTTWNMGDGTEYEDRQARQTSVSHTYYENGSMTIEFVAEEQGGRGGVIQSDTLDVLVINPPSNRPRTEIPSMDEAAEAKEREY